jgi:hypothetical protein
MKRGVLNRRSRGMIAVLVMAAMMSCGAGIRDGQGDVYVTKTIGQEGDQIVLGEATLDVWQDCLASDAVITLRRFAFVRHGGAVSPVFEIQVPSPGTFQKDPRIGISTSSMAVISPSPVIGFLVPGVDNEQWVPDSSSPSQPCSGPVVCGPVQIKGFTEPGGSGSGLPQTTRLQFAIVTQCQSPADCPGGQTCTAMACQICPTSSPCN